MERKPAQVKGKRVYDASRRREQAAHTRAAILAAARDRFLRDGLGATTIASIANDADVSVDTIYKSYGGKPGVLRALCADALAGEGPVPAETRSDALQRSDATGVESIRGFGKLSAEVAPRIAPLLLLIRDGAATSTELAQLRAELDRQRLDRMTHNARNLADAGHLRRGVTVEHAGEIMWTYTAPELYELLVLRRGWSVRRYSSFLADAMIAALLPDRSAAAGAPA
jgi:AcrR family transcriptional regulator